MHYFLLQEIAYIPEMFIRHKRREFDAIAFPKVRKIENTVRYLKVVSKDKVSHDFLVPKSDCQNILETLERHSNRFNVARIDQQLYDVNDIKACIRILEARELQQQMGKEDKWLDQVEIRAPSGFPTVDNAILKSFQNLIKNNCHEKQISPYYPTVLTSDVTLLIGQGWINLNLIEIFSSFINNSTQDCVINSLTTLLTSIEMGDLAERVKDYHQSGKKCFIIIINVFQNKDLSTEAAKIGQQGNHWTTLTVDFEQEIWFYSDTLGWSFPNNLFKLILPFVRALREVYQLTLPFDNLKIAHPHLSSVTVCDVNCVKNFPYQYPNLNICGIASLFVAYLLSFNAIRQLVISKSKMPSFLNWIFKISDYNDYLRMCFIKWFMIDGIDLNFTRCMSQVRYAMFASSFTSSFIHTSKY